MILSEPECSSDKLTPCSPENWIQCDECHRLVCEVHDCLFPVWHLTSDEFGPCDRLCRSCVEMGWYRSEIGQELDGYVYSNY